MGEPAAGSLARRLSLELAAIAALLSVLLYLAVRSLSTEAAVTTHDGILGASVEAIAEQLGTDGSGVLVDLPYGALAMLGAVSDDRVFYRITTARETLTGYDDLPLPERLPGPGETTFFNESYRGSPVRIAALSRRITVGSGSLGVVTLVAQTLDGQRDIVARVAGRATLLGAGSFALAGALGALAVARAVAPLRRVASALERRGAQDLTPLAEPLPRELAPLGAALDGFIGRLDASLERTETFIAEAAHHVRTPLAVVRTRAETALRQSGDSDVRATLRALVRAVDESARSADQLLEHAMVTHRSERMTRERLAIDDLLHRLLRSFEPLVELRDLQMRVTVEAGLHTVADRVQIETALRNLLDNALKYSSADSLIEVTAHRDHGGILISVRDQGRGLQGISVDRLTERYRRGSNVADVVGSGLGLAIVSQVASAHAGRFNIGAAPDRGTIACLWLPAAHS